MELDSKTLITRPEPSATALRTTLKEHRVNSTLSPLLTIAPLSPSNLNIANLQAVIITSRHALQAAQQHAHLPFYIVGSATAELAKTMQLNVKAHAADVHALCKIILSELSPKDGGLLYLSGKDISTALPPLLPAFNHTRIVTYHAQAQRLSAQAIEDIRTHQIASISLLSVRTAKIFMQEIRTHQLEISLKSCAAFCFSPAIANIARQLPFAHSIAIAAPTEDCLVKTLASHHKAIIS